MEPTGKLWREYHPLLPSFDRVAPSTLQSQCHMGPPIDLLASHLYAALLHCCTIDVHPMHLKGAASAGIARLCMTLTPTARKDYSKAWA